MFLNAAAFEANQGRFNARTVSTRFQSAFSGNKQGEESAGAALVNKAAQGSDNKRWVRQAVKAVSVSVYYGQPAGISVGINAGEVFGDARDMAQTMLAMNGVGINLDGFRLVDKASRFEVRLDEPVYQSMAVLLCHAVDVVGDVDHGTVFVEHGKLMSSSKVLADV